MFLSDIFPPRHLGAVDLMIEVDAAEVFRAWKLGDIGDAQPQAGFVNKYYGRFTDLMVEPEHFSLHWD